MAKYLRSSFGSISGTLNNSVASKWRGVDYLKNISKKSDKPLSLKQLGVQAKLVLSAHYLARIKNVLNLGFSDKKLNKATGYNVAVREFINHAITGEYPDFSIDYSKMLLSRGALHTLNVTSVELVDNNSLKLAWSYAEDPMLGYTDDEVMVVVYNVTDDRYMTNRSAKRFDGELNWELAVKPQDHLQIWAFCIGRYEKSVSKSQYLGVINMPELPSI